MTDLDSRQTEGPTNPRKAPLLLVTFSRARRIGCRALQAKLKKPKKNCLKLSFVCVRQRKQNGEGLADSLVSRGRWHKLGSNKELQMLTALRRLLLAGEELRRKPHSSLKILCKEVLLGVV